jgi:ribosomal protein S18 acetylase RimI-like enzyme
MKLLELQFLATSPHAQRRGVGTKLVEDWLREADAAGWQSVLVS